MRRPPTSNLFPTRRSSDLIDFKRLLGSLKGSNGAQRQARRQRPCRSEEHTSELQSHLNLVCRLLLEKKKSTRNRASDGSRGRGRPSRGWKNGGVRADRRIR